MLSTYCQNVLKAELQKPDYNGLTADQGWAWLMLPTSQPPLSQPTGAMLTPVVTAKLLGPAKAEAIAAALRASFPTIADHLMTEGVNPLDQSVQAFLSGLVAANKITAADAATLAATASVSVPQPDIPPRFHDRFQAVTWPHVAADGSVGGPTDPPISGFPNTIARPDFDAAWIAAGRS